MCYRRIVHLSCLLPLLDNRVDGQPKGNLPPSQGNYAMSESLQRREALYTARRRKTTAKKVQQMVPRCPIKI